MSKRLLNVLVFSLLGIQMSISQVLYDHEKNYDNGSVYKSRCTEYLRNEFKMFEGMKVLSCSDLKLSNGNTFVFMKVKLAFSYNERGYVPNRVLGTASRGVSMATVRKGDNLTELHMIAVDNNGEPIKHFKMSEEFYIYKLLDGYYLFVLGEESKKFNGISYTFNKRLVCFDYEGNQRWSSNSDLMTFSMLKTNYNLYVVGELANSESCSIIQVIDIKTGNVISEKVGENGNVCISISGIDEGLQITEYIKRNNNNRKFIFPYETRDKENFARKLMNSYDKSKASDQVKIGERYLNGKGFDKDAKKAFEWFMKSAEQNDTRGCERVAYCYLNGIGVGIDKAKAISYYEKAAIAGDKTAITSAAKMYADGDGIQKNMSRALYWKECLAFQGDKDAQKYVLSHLSEMHEKNSIDASEARSMAQNSYKQKEYRWAEYLIQRAIELGNNEARLDYGSWLVKDEMAQKNYSKAEEYLTPFAGNGNVEAMILLSKMFERLNDKEKEMYWIAKAAENNDNESLYKLYVAYKTGVGVKKNKKLAQSSLQKAAEFGNQNALREILIELASSKKAHNNIETILFWFKKMNYDTQLEIVKSYTVDKTLYLDYYVEKELTKYLASTNRYEGIEMQIIQLIQHEQYLEAKTWLGKLTTAFNTNEEKLKNDLNLYFGIIDELYHHDEMGANIYYSKSNRPEAKDKNLRTRLIQ